MTAADVPRTTRAHSICQANVGDGKKRMRARLQEEAAGPPLGQRSAGVKRLHCVAMERAQAYLGANQPSIDAFPRPSGKGDVLQALER
jgi:hypothetical protein